MTTVALAGNPNSGKTTVFNALTGTHQRVGNWPGVTVERKTGHCHYEGRQIDLVDLPGTYSIAPVGNGIDEQIAREFLAETQVDAVINIVDAASLSRGLYLTSDPQGLGLPMVVAINMIDVAQSQGIEIDTKTLAEQLGCPVIPLIASRGKGLDALLAASTRHRSAMPSLPGTTRPAMRASTPSSRLVPTRLSRSRAPGLIESIPWYSTDTWLSRCS